MNSNRQTPDIHLQGYTSQDRAGLLPLLGLAIDHAGGWVLERRSTGPVTLDLHLEVQSIALPDVYGALLESGVELTRGSHRALAERCNCGLHMRPSHGIGSVLSVCLEMHFLPEQTEPMDLARLLVLGAAAA